MHADILETISRDMFLCFSEKYYLILNCVFYEKKKTAYFVRVKLIFLCFYIRLIFG